MKLTYAVTSTVGVFRGNNQDNFFVNGITKPMERADDKVAGTSQKQSQLFAVMDGMGGEQRGELAAFIAVEQLKKVSVENFYDQWMPYILDANEQICKAEKDYAVSMGTTVAIVSVHNDMLRAVNLGDSRIYQIRGETIEQLSKDHTEFQALVDAGVLKKEECPNSKARHYLTQHMGIPKSVIKLQPYVCEAQRLQEGDYYLLCSDGLHGVVSEEMMLEMILGAGTVQEKCNSMVEQAEKLGSRDNITAMLVAVEQEKSKDEQDSAVKRKKSFIEKLSLLFSGR